MQVMVQVSPPVNKLMRLLISGALLCITWGCLLKKLSLLIKQNQRKLSKNFHFCEKAGNCQPFFFLLTRIPISTDIKRNRVTLGLLKICIMRKIMLAIFILFATKIVAQKDTAKLLVGFPITSYMVDLNDSTKVVQIVQGGLWDIKDKQLGLVKGIYRDGHVDTAMKGWGKCQLIKGDYYYFAVHYGNKAPELTAGDLLYTFIKMPDQYIGQLTKIA